MCTLTVKLDTQRETRFLVVDGLLKACNSKTKAKLTPQRVIGRNLQGEST